MANMLFANNCNTTLASSLTSGATSMSVTSATGFPSPTGVQYFYCTLADAATQTTIEIVKVTSVSGTTFAITRAQDGTSATAFAAGAVVSLRLVRASLNDFPKLDETNTFNADQTISGQLTSSAGLATTGTFTATAPSDGLVMDYATGFGRFSAFAGDGFQWYNAGIANTKLMQLSSSGAITTATWNGVTVGVAYGGTGLTSLTAGYIPYGNGTSAFASSSNFYYNGTDLNVLSGNAIARAFVPNSLIVPSLGMFAPAANTLGFATNSAQIAQFDSSGRFYMNSTTTLAFGSGLMMLKNNADNCIQIEMNSNNSGVVVNQNTVGGTYLAYWGYRSANVGSIQTNGTTTSYNVTSDKRLKNDEGILEDTFIIDNTEVHNFSWKLNGQKDKGVFAQDAYLVNPLAVSKGEDNEDGTIKTPWSVDYSKYVPDLIVYCKQLKATIILLEVKLKSAGIAGF